MTKNDLETRGRPEDVDKLLSLLPTKSVLRETAEPVYDMVHIEADGYVRERHVYDRGFVLADKWEWRTGPDGGEVLRGKRLILLSAPALELQEIEGRGRRPGAVQWTARSRPLTCAQVLEHWTLDQVRAGVAGVLRAARLRPERILLRTTRSLLQLQQDDPDLEPRHVIDDGRPPQTKDETSVQLMRRANDQAVREGRARELWGEGGPAAMTTLCRLFPALQGVAGVEPWNPNTMLRLACRGVTPGGQHAARFVLRVWSSTTDWERLARSVGLLTDQQRLPPFDAVEATAVWGRDGNLDAMMTWLNDPFRP
jgi:hypothetical protein